ncbi:hypothetical protein TBR22_A35930 [Luteitalea sp. TBR-22]|uniref:hypothetical protein n=1 Tax=Luteitalea sp. TBR-22 TaxID=2802971 RepID=UPI001AF05E3B|nr:hypothetical protein [Luteitalea sp. TBR-22]BCS34363.1 hypothetical protein TBR22_A35930 [Luteitalea sp. TBR-22]
MSQVWHLVRHDLQAHRGILLAWLATVIALPLIAFLPWSDRLAAGVGVGAAVAFQAARVLLGMTAVASMVQAGSPIDDQAFWRTRPLAPHALAAAHIVTAAALFVLLPTLVVLLVAVALDLPRSHWLSSAVQVFATESALAGFGLVVASRTRGIATFIVAAVVGLATTFFLVGALGEVRRLLEWPGYLQMADPSKALWAMIVIAALLLPLLFVVAMAGPRRQRTFLAGVLVVLVLCVGVWFVPALRFEPPPLLDANLSFTSASVRLDPVPGSPGAASLVLVATPRNTLPGDEWRLSLKYGKLVTSAGTRWLKGTAPGYVPPLASRDVPVVIAVLSASEVKALAGTSVRIDAELHGNVDRQVIEARAVLAPGARLSTDHQQLSVLRGLDGEPDPVSRRRPVVEALEIYLSTWKLGFRHGHAYVVRDRARGCELNGYAWPTPRSRVLRWALLPTLMPPFTVMRVQLSERIAAECTVDHRDAEIEMRSIGTQAVSNVPVSLEFTMPATTPAP